MSLFLGITVELELGNEAGTNKLVCYFSAEFILILSIGQQVKNNSKQDIDSGQMQEEKEAAEEFEQMNEYQLDFGID